MSRDIHEVICKIVDQVPESEPSIRKGLLMISDAYLYSAPEVKQFAWDDVADYLNAHCQPTRSDWEMKIYKIFGDKDDNTEK